MKVMRFGPVLLLSLLGCHQLGPETWIIPLAEMKAELQLGGRGEYSTESPDVLSLHVPSRGHCSVLSPRDTIVTINGSRGRFDPGGGDPFNDGACFGPSFWAEDDPDGQVTLVIDDKTAQWTFVLWDPFQYVVANITSHGADEDYQVGDSVVVTLSPPGTYTDITVRGERGGTLAFALSEGNGLVIDGETISFVMPELAGSSTSVDLRLSIRGTRHVQVDRCDAPLGCETMASFEDGDWIDVYPAAPLP
jgi:hypothetical protein